ncbi:flavodoxin family protein [Desulfofalx alkaliphila]|uniref:flavodoxin family protein n=1 Tax=Desulfofalx alkaliphila TaxID=105483 RepID=UPI0004E1CC26|nr:flavodoxin family protein [Desulfofalx alkaliphila]
MEEKVYILGFTGSPRRDGNTERLMHIIMEGAKSQGAVTETVHLRNLRLKQCIACECCRAARVCKAHRDDMQLLYPKIKAAQGLILGSPTYNYNITARMKILIDRMYPFYYFNPENRHQWRSLLPPNKKALIYSVCEQPNDQGLGIVMEAMLLPLKALGVSVVDQLTAKGFFEKGAVLKDEILVNKAYNAGKELVNKIKEGRKGHSTK